MAENQHSEQTSDRSNGMKNLRFLLSYIHPYRYVFLVGLVSLAITALAIMVIPKILSELINEINFNRDSFLEKRNKLMATAAIVLVIQAVFSYLRILTFTYVMEKGMANLRTDLLQNILESRIAFFDTNRVGALMSRMTSDVSTVQDAFSINLAEFLRQLIIITVGIILLINISWKLTLTMLISLPVFILLAFVFGRFIRKLSRKKQDALAASNVIAEESFSNIRVVKAFNQESSEGSRYASALDQVVTIAIGGARYRGAFISFVVVGLFTVLFLLFFQGVQLAFEGVIELGDLVAFVLYTAFIGGSITGLGDLATKFQSIIGSTDRIVELLHQEDEFKDLSKEPIQIDGGLTFNSVSFSYPSRKEIAVLNDITFHVEAGETVALVGHSGAGKTTIFQLLLQYYTPTTGSIYYDDHASTSSHPTVFRDNLSVVPQDVVLFGGTIRENIAYGKQDATDAEVRAAAQQANAMEFIDSFPEGLDTIVGERGIKLSGGQRQRVAIARAILKDPAILLLDEATSSLDAASEQLIQSALEGLMKNRTTIVIAHRLSTIRNADRILVINHGTIVESGSHEELIRNEDGLYKHLLKLQYQIA